RSVITNAKLGGLEDDLNMTDIEYRWCLSIYYFGFILFEIPSNIILRRWKPSYYLSFLVFTWGIIVMSAAGVTSAAGLLVSRFMLGAMEAGIIWGLIAFGITFISKDRLNTWQWMFIIEGSPCIALAIICFVFLPDKPETAKFIDEEERKMEIERLAADLGAGDDRSWSWNQVTSIFTDWKSYMYTLTTITSAVSGVGVNIALPSIIAGLGSWTPQVSLALTVPPYILACILTLVLCRTSDKYFERGYHIIGGSFLRFIGLLLLMFLPIGQIGARYFAVCISAAPTYTLLAIRTAWLSNNFSGMTRRAVACGFIQGFGSIGSAIGAQVYFDGPRFFWGHTIAFIFLSVEIILTFIMRLMFRYENKKRDNMTLDEKQQVIRKYENKPELLGDRHPDFRYVL
ncbi:major facilitator superfamily domain-containing protein, partial [Circinella umbellata]